VSVQSIWVCRRLTDSSDEVLYPPIEDESCTKVWEASFIPPSPNSNSTKASSVTYIDLLDGIDIQANYTINADIVLCSDKNEPTSENVLTEFWIVNTNLIKEGFPLFSEERLPSPTFIRNLSQIDFGITSVVENVPKYAVLLKGVQTQDIQIVFPLKVDAVTENYSFDVYYDDGTNFTKIQSQDTYTYKVYDANLENTNSRIIIVLEGDDPTDNNNRICELRKNGCWVDDSIFKIDEYSQVSDTYLVYAMYGSYGYDNTPFTLEMTNASDYNE